MLPIVVHPAFVHFPLAMLSTAWVCLLLWHRGWGDDWQRRVRLFEVIGVVALPITILTGFIDEGGVAFLTSPDWGDPLVWHVLGALAASVVFTTHWNWRRTRSFAGLRDAAVMDVGIATTGLWLFVLAGAVAGEMVHG